MIRFVKISVTGVNSDELSAYLKNEVLRIEGVMRVNACREDAVLEVKYDNSLVNFNFIRETIEKSGCRVI